MKGLGDQSSLLLRDCHSEHCSGNGKPESSGYQNGPGFGTNLVQGLLGGDNRLFRLRIGLPHLLQEIMELLLSFGSNDATPDEITDHTSPRWERRCLYLTLLLYSFLSTLSRVVVLDGYLPLITALLGG